MAKRRELEIRKVLRENLRSRRVQLNLKQREVADLVGLSDKFVQAIESPHVSKIPNLALLERLAVALKCQPHDLLFPNRFGGEVDADGDLRAVAVRN